MHCIRCSCKIKENGQFYIAGDMGPEIIALLEQSLGLLYDRDGHFCSQCFASITKLLPTEPPESDDDTLSVASSIPSVSIKSEMDSDVTDDTSEDLATVSAMPVKSVASKHVGVERLLNGKLCHSAYKEAEGRQIKILAPRQKETEKPKPVSSATVSTVPVRSVTSQLVEVERLLNGKRCHSAYKEAEKRRIKIIAPRQKETEKPKPVSSATVSTVPVRSVASKHVGVDSLLNGKLCHSVYREADKRHIKIIAPRQKETEKPELVSSATFSAVPVRSVASQRVGVESLLNGKQCHAVSREHEKRHIKNLAPQQKESENPNPGSSDTRKLPKRKPRIPYPHDLLSSPMRKMPRSHSLTSNEKYIALNIYKYINKMTTTYPYKMDILAQVAEIIGTSTSTINRVLQEYKSTGRFSSPPPRNPRPRTTLFEKLDANEIDKIKRIVRQLEVTNEVSVDKVISALRENGDMPKFSRTTFYRVLQKLNIKFKNSRNPKDIE